MRYGKDIAGKIVLVHLFLILTSCVDQESDPIDLENSELYPFCAVTRTLVKINAKQLGNRTLTKEMPVSILFMFLNSEVLSYLFTKQILRILFL